MKVILEKGWIKFNVDNPRATESKDFGIFASELEDFRSRVLLLRSRKVLGNNDQYMDLDTFTQMMQSLSDIIELLCKLKDAGEPLFAAGLRNETIDLRQDSTDVANLQDNLKKIAERHEKGVDAARKDAPTLNYFTSVQIMVWHGIVWFLF